MHIVVSVQNLPSSKNIRYSIFGAQNNVSAPRLDVKSVKYNEYVPKSFQ